jgi:HSP20 family protein
MLINTGLLKAMLSNERWSRQSSRCIWRPPTDVYETEQDVVVRVEISGMRREDFEVTFENGVLRIDGFRGDADQKRAYHVMEIPFGHFCSEVVLGRAFNLNSEQMSARYENGFLLVTMPKVE